MSNPLSGSSKTHEPPSHSTSSNSKEGSTFRTLATITIFVTTILAIMGKISPQTAGWSYCLGGAVKGVSLDKSDLQMSATSCTLGYFLLQGALDVSTAGYIFLIPVIVDVAATALIFLTFGSMIACEVYQMFYEK